MFRLGQHSELAMGFPDDYMRPVEGLRALDLAVTDFDRPRAAEETGWRLKSLFR